jgi:uncharacterized membrane-anchored protein YhcB (DUF1043 family)
MKKIIIVITLVFSFIAGSVFSTDTAMAGESVATLQKQIKSLQTTISSFKKQISSKDKQISELKKQIATKDKEINVYKSKSVNVLKTKVAFEGNVKSGNYQYLNNSVPVSLEYKGVRYSPVSMISEMIGFKTVYKNKEDVIHIGSEPDGSYMSDLMEPYFINYDSLEINKSMKMANQNYNKGYSFDLPSYYDFKQAFNLNGKYKNIKGTLGLDDSRNTGEVKVTFIGDGTEISTITILEGGLPVDFNLDVSNIMKLEITAYSTNGLKVNIVNTIIN